MDAKYRRVYFHPGRNVWQATQRGLPSVTHADQDECASLAAKLWKTPVDSLSKSVVKTVPQHREVKQYKYASWHSSKQTWVVMDGRRYVGCDKSLPAALQVATTYFKCTAKDLVLQEPQPTGSNSADLCQRMSFFLGVYGSDLPGDLMDLLGSAQKVGKLITSKLGTSGLLVPYLVSKFPVHRAAVLHAVKARRKQQGTYEVLVEACRAVARCKLEDAWVRNVGRKNMFHATLVMYARGQLGLLSKAAKAKPGANTIVFGKGKSMYRIAQLTPKLKKRLERLEVFGKAVEDLKPPRSVKEWRAAVGHLESMAKRTPGLSGGYRKFWAIRCSLILRMRQAGISSLKLGDVTVRDFRGLFPDQKDLLTKLAGGRYMLHRKISDVFKDCSYKGPPELFTMWACLIADRSVSRVSLDWLKDHKVNIARAYKDLKRSFKLTPHPGVLLEEVERSQRVS